MITEGHVPRQRTEFFTFDYTPLRISKGWLDKFTFIDRRSTSGSTKTKVESLLLLLLLWEGTSKKNSHVFLLYIT